MSKFEVRRSEGRERPKFRSDHRKRMTIEAKKQEQAEEETEEESEWEEVEEGDKSGADRSSVEEPIGDRCVNVTLTDPEVFDCPVCLDILTIPVFQCENGHLACSACCTKIKKKCPSCSLPIGSFRCRAIEKVLDSVKVLCPNTKYGCKETVAYWNKHDHERKCIYTQCSCPVPDCNFISNSQNLYLHFRTSHPDSAKRFFFNRHFSISFAMDKKYIMLQEQKEGVIYILSNGVETLGNVVSVSCIGPSSLKMQLEYNLVAKNGGSKISLQSSPVSIPMWVEKLPLKKFLLVPRDFIGSDRELKLEVHIRKLHYFAV